MKGSPGRAPSRKVVSSERKSTQSYMSGSLRNSWRVGFRSSSGSTMTENMGSGLRGSSGGRGSPIRPEGGKVEGSVVRSNLKSVIYSSYNRDSTVSFGKQHSAPH